MVLLKVYILLEVWIPVRLSRPWKDSPVMVLMQKLMRRILRTGWMVGLIIVVAVLLEIIALTANATTAGVLLHKEVQTAEFDWHMHSQELCTQQNKIDRKMLMK